MEANTSPTEAVADHSTVSPTTPDDSDLTITQADLDDGNYECVSGTFFKDGQYVPLDERATRTTQARVLRGIESVVDVEICGMTTFVFVESKADLDKIEHVLWSTVGEQHDKTSEDNRRYTDAEFALQFRPRP